MNQLATHGRNLSVALLCASFAHSAFPIGLGNIKVTSKLNEPFRARIDIIESNAIPLRDLRVMRADKSEYERAGLVYSNDVGYLHYAIAGDVSKPYITVKSKENVAEPFINILLKLQWPKGDVFRAYSVLLDPPDYQLSQVTSSHQALSISKRDQAQTRSAKKEYGSAVERAVHPGRTSHVVVTKDTDTLWHIARDIQEERTGLSVYQIMVSVYQSNPEDFINRDINKLKKHSRLEIPTTKTMSKVSREQAFQSFNTYLESPITQAPHKPNEHKPKPSQKSTPVTTRVKPVLPTASAPKKTSAQPVVKKQDDLNVLQQIVVPEEESAPAKQTIQVKPTAKVTKPQSQPKAKTQPKLQMDESDPEDESNLWFLDTFNFEEEKPAKNTSPNNQVSSQPTKLTQSASEPAIKPSTELNVSAPVKKKETVINPNSSKHQVLADLISEQNIKFAAHAQQLKKLSAQVDQLMKAQSAKYKKQQTIQAAAIVDSDDNFWEIFWFITTMIGLSSSIYLAYRLYLLSKIDGTEAAKADFADVSFAQDAIALSKRKIQSAKETAAEAIDNISERVGKVKAEAPVQNTELKPNASETVIPEIEAPPEMNAPQQPIPEVDAFKPPVQPTKTSQASDPIIPEIKFESKPEVKPQSESIPEVQPDVVSESQVEVQSESIPEVQPDVVSESQVEVQSESIPEVQPEVMPQADVNSMTSSEPTSSLDVEEIILDDEPVVEQTTTMDQPSADTSTDDNTIEFDSSFSGKYQIGRKGERSDEVITDIDIPAESVDSQPIAQPEASATIGTKIDLATAYITMDDKQNARAILSEILEEGNEHEKQIAQKLIQELDKH